MLFQLLKKFLFLLILFHSSFTAHAYQVKIQFLKNELPSVELYGFYGSENFFIKKYESNNGIINFDIPTVNFYEGFYRLKFNDQVSYDFVVAKNDSILIRFDPDEFSSTLKIEWSEDNKKLLSLKKELSSIHFQIELVKSVNPIDSLTQFTISVALNNLFEEKNKILENYCASFSNPVFCKLTKMNKEIITENHTASFSTYFQNIDLTDSCIIRTNLFPGKIIDYFAFNTDLDEVSFKNGIDSILTRSKSNHLVYEYTLYYFLNLFGKVGPEVIFQYLLKEYYLVNSCDLQIENKDLLSQIDKFVSLMPGNKSPELIGRSVKGKEIAFFSELNKADETIIIFWNPDCHFCKEIIPELIKKYNSIQKNNKQIISFAITSDKGQWESAIKTLKFPWIEMSDLKGWDSENVKKFMVTKTPFFIKLNKEGMIIEFDKDPESLLE